MSFVVNFLVLAECIENFSKKDIDQGKTPANIYYICCCLREAFCLSYAIRKANNFYIYFTHERIVFKFVGRELRFMGSDERSQVLLFLRALNEINQRKAQSTKEWIKSTPGIYVKNLDTDEAFCELLNSIDSQSIALILLTVPSGVKIAELEAKEYIFSGNLETYFYILPIFDIVEKYGTLMQKLKTNDRIKFFTMSSISEVRDRIMWFNYQKDVRQ